MFLGLRTVIYPAPDLAAAKDWYSAVLGAQPYFDEVFYVGYNVGGYELALDPNGDPASGPVIYWGVPNVDAALAALVGAGASVRDSVREVGDSIRVAVAADPNGNAIGVIENPHFRVVDVADPDAGPGR